MPLANSFLKSPEEFAAEQFYPLDLYFCENCSLVQLLDVIDPEVLFRNYIYVTGTSETMAAHNRNYAESVIESGKLEPKDLVVEIASNDGTLLNFFRLQGFRILGVEPAENISRLARENGIPTINDFFNSSCAERILSSNGPARVVLANNVLAHVDDTVGFLKGCRTLLTENGFVVLEVPYLRELLQNLEYDTVYHEHLCYFSITTLMRLCERVNLGIFRMDFVPVHGGSLRMFAAPGIDHSNSVVMLAADEEKLDMTRRRRYESFADKVQQHRTELRSLLERFKSDGRNVVAYGAPAKGNTLLNYCDIGTDLVSHTVDKSPLKVGRYTPGKHLPVRAVGSLLEEQPDYVLLLAWNFANEIMQQQQEYSRRGGRFILPLPRPEVINEIPPPYQRGGKVGAE
ncbi:class I SAM-dependent methyltransferase [bacterium]|nr:class I SAM-dependent methyltransferase [bacterium]